MILTFRPIKIWPDSFNREHLDRHDSPFRATYRDTLDVLSRELWHLGAEEAILQVDASERDCRLDGQLRSDAKVAHPGVILSFDTPGHGTLTYACDRYQRPTYGQGRDQASWKHNFRAIALGLEALRKVERYGIAERGQQYAGYRELGTGIPMGPAPFTVESAARFIAGHAGRDWSDEISADPAAALAMFKDAAKIHHPDAGGDPEVFKQLTAARDVLAGAGL